MKKKCIFVIFVFFLIIFFGCGEGVKKVDLNSDESTLLTISSIEETLIDTSCFKTSKILLLETNGASLISEIRKISIDGDLLFIFDKKQMKILIFDTNGNYINQIHKVGQGPGEYIQFMDFSIDIINKEIILLCDIPNKIIYFSYNGEFLREEYLEEYYRQIVFDENYIYFDKLIDTGANELQLTIVDRNSNTKKEGLPKIVDIQNRLFVGGNSFNKGTNIYYVRRLDNSIYEITNGEIHKKYSLDFKKHSIPDNQKKEEDDVTFLQICNQNEYIFTMVNVVNCDRYLMFMTNIAIFLYDKSSNVLKGYKQISNTDLDELSTSFMPLVNTNKVVCIIDPTFIMHTTTHIAQKEKMDEKNLLLVNIASKLRSDSNPVLVIYEFKD